MVIKNHKLLAELCLGVICDYELAKRVLIDWEILGNHANRQKNMSLVPMENYIFLERRKFLLSKNI